MIIDTLDNSGQYAALGPRIARAFDWMRATDMASLPAGRHEIEGSDIYALILDITTKPADPNNWEAHHRYLDIQAPLTGDEIIAYAPIHRLTQTSDFDEEKDYCFLSGEGTLELLHPGMFALLLPQDGHKPGIAAGAPQAIRKVVMKVLV